MAQTDKKLQGSEQEELLKIKITNLSFVAHRNLNKNHGIAHVGLLHIIITWLERRVYRNWLDLFPLDPHTSEAKKNPISGLKEEEVDAKIDKELKWWCDVSGSQIDPADIYRMWQIPHSSKCWGQVRALDKVPAHHMSCHFHTQHEDRENQESCNGLEQYPSLSWLWIFCCTGRRRRSHTLSQNETFVDGHHNCPQPQCHPCEESSCSVSFEQQYPRQLLGILPPLVFLCCCREWRRSRRMLRALNLQHSIVRVFHLHHHRSSPELLLLLLIPPLHKIEVRCHLLLSKTADAKKPPKKKNATNVKKIFLLCSRRTRTITTRSWGIQYCLY